MPPDPKPPARVKDPALLGQLRREWRSCVLCGGTWRITLHHLVRRSQGGSDVRENLIPLCQGPGTHDCHGRLHQGDDDIAAWVEAIKVERGL